MTSLLSRLLVAGLFWPAALQAASAQSSPGDPEAAADCARFDETEAAGKGRVAALIAVIDGAAEIGDNEAFCRASFDLVLVYRTMAKAAAGCSPESAERWAEAGEASMSALGPTCR